MCKKLICLALVAIAPWLMAAAAPAPTPVVNNTGLRFIDTGFENASPLWYDFAADGTIQIHLMYDHERDSPNRAAGHFHFQLVAAKGTTLTLEFLNLDNVYNGRPGSVAKELKVAMISENGRDWQPVPTQALPGDRVRMSVYMSAEKLFVARVEPYRLSDLDRLLAGLKGNPLVEIKNIGKTVEGRELEIVRLGDPAAPHRVFVRARAHPWEPGGNWVIEGLTERLLRGDAEAQKFLKKYCVWIMPMANKDGVAHGRTRFNPHGVDLNRGWAKPADPETAPENAALEGWLDGMIKDGKKPELALELHNDGNGRLHVGKYTTPEGEAYVKRMAKLEGLLRKDTWFTEGVQAPVVTKPSTLGEGWLARYGIDAAVHEFNANWIAGLKDYPSAKHWKEYGAGLAQVFYEYFE